MYSVRFAGILLVVVLALGSLAPALAQDDEITLVPFTSELYGVEGLIPEGWSEAAPGVYARGASAMDLTSLIIQAAPGMTADALSGVLLGQLGIDALPESTGTIETEDYTWTQYEIGVQQAGLSIKVDLALAEDDAGVTLVLLQTLEDSYDALHEAVFLPVVEALAPVSAEDVAARRSMRTRRPFSSPIPLTGAERATAKRTSPRPNELITVSILTVEPPT